MKNEHNSVTKGYKVPSKIKSRYSTYFGDKPAMYLYSFKIY